MKPVTSRSADEVAHLIQARWGQPSSGAAAAYRIAISLGFVGSPDLMEALMSVDPQLDRRRDSGDVSHVQNDKLRGRCRGIVIEVRIKHGREATARHAMTVKHKPACRHDRDLAGALSLRLSC
jgi:hypothetical protein